MTSQPSPDKDKHPSTTPPPEDDRKPESPAQITRPSWKYALKTTMREFSADGCGDLAAGLTYRSVFSLVPTILALVSILSIFGQGQALSSVLEEVRGIVPTETWDTISPLLDTLLSTPAPGIGLLIGLLTALWAASGYVKAFGRAMNIIYDVPEGRGVIKLTVQMYALTALILVLGALSIVIFVVSGPIAEAVGNAIGLGSVAVTVWNVAKWFVLALIVVVVVALLYYATPNVRQPRFRWISMGALIAIVVSVIATLGFFFYVSNFGNYNATYGALAGVIILLLWMYLINTILLVGAEVDSEIERARQLQAGIEAERELQLPARDTKASDKKAEQLEQQVEEGTNLRLSEGETLEAPSGDASRSDAPGRSDEPGRDTDSAPKVEQPK